MSDEGIKNLYSILKENANNPNLTFEFIKDEFYKNKKSKKFKTK
jgi:hypothetical protein